MRLQVAKLAEKIRATIAIPVLALGVFAPVETVFAADAEQGTQPPSQTRRCLVARSIDGWNRIDDRTLILTVSPRHRYKVTFVNPCRQANWAWAARVQGFGMCIRPGDTLIFNVGAFRSRHDGFEQSCFIHSIEELPPPAEKPAATGN